MKIISKDTLDKYFNPEHKFTWISVIFIVKAVFFAFFFPYEIIEPHMIGLTGGDTSSYFLPIENLLKSGHYSPDYRMPGYGSVYLLLRLMLNNIDSSNSLIILQWILSSLSVYYLAKSVLLVTNTKSLFNITLCLYLISTSSNVLDYYLLTESFTTSSLIFSCFYLIKYIKEERKEFLIFAGVFACWSIFMRPVLLPVIGIIVIVLAIHQTRLKIKRNQILISTIIFCAPFLICDSIWTTRNYIHHHKFAPLTSTNFPLELENTYYNELMGFVISWGGDRTWWNPPAEIRWFVNKENQFGSYTQELPTYIYTSAFNKDSLVHIRSLISIIENPAADSVSRKRASDLVRANLKRYTLSIRHEKPLLYYFTSKIYLFKKFIYHSGTPLLFTLKFSELNLFCKLVKLFYSFLYVLILALGSVGILISLIQIRRLPVGFLIFPAFSIYIILIYPILGHIEYRYLVPAFPFLIVCTSQTILALKNLLTFNGSGIA